MEEFKVGALWMLRPWLYADQLLPHFDRFRSVESLAKRLREVYPNISALEELAVEKGVPIHEPFQGSKIGAFIVLAPSPARYGQLILDSEKTPESSTSLKEETTLEAIIRETLAKMVTLAKAAWGEEHFSNDETSAENEMSVVQYANLNGKKILLTGDAGRTALTEAADYAPVAGLILPGIDRFQVPHHGGRRNVSTDVLVYCTRLSGHKVGVKRPA